MEINELKHIWGTLANEKLIDIQLAEENIERIIAKESSNTVDKLNKKFRRDFANNIIRCTLVVAATIVAAIVNARHNSKIPVQGYIFLMLAFSFYAFLALNRYSRIKLLKLSFNTLTLLDSLRKIKQQFGQISSKENMITYIAVAILTVYGNILINEHTDFSNFDIISLQGFVLVFSIIYLIALPWIVKAVFNKRFSGIIRDIDSSIAELTEN